MKASYVKIDGKFYSPGHPKVRAFAQKYYVKPNRPSMGQLPHPKSEQRKVPSLASGTSSRTRRRNAMGRIRVQIISLRKRLIDDDNLVGGAKALRDAIAQRLGLDDGDSRITFEYSQIKTPADCGTHVIIQGILNR